MDRKITYDDINWHQLWENARKKKSWTPKGPADWDKKAPSFAKRNSDSPFVDLVLQHIPASEDMTILDAGSGPGTLSLPLAERVRSVTAIDYSRGMLDALEEMALEQGIFNIRTVQGSYEDDWRQLDIEPHDICIASRSLSVADLGAALTKLNEYARRRVIVVDRIGPTPFDPGAFKAVNRPFRSGPDYIYTVNTLYSMGIHPSVNIISLQREKYFKDMEKGMESLCWMFKDLNPEEKERLQQYILANSQPAEDGGLLFHMHHRPSWAVISWQKEG